MSLRLRLVAALFLLSVVPLGVVTLYTYASNAAAMREAAGREAAFLTRDLRWRMDMVTARVTERVGHLIDLSAPGATPASASAVLDEEDVVQALGDMAVLLDNVELRGRRRSDGRGNRPATGGSSPRSADERDRPDGVPAEPGQADTEDRLRVDLGPIRRALLQQIVPDGQWQELSDRERQQIRATVDRLLLGLAQEAPLAAAEVQQAVQAARRKAVMSGSHIEVVDESDGQVVHRASADLNLANLLGTLFTATPRNRGELPFALAVDGQLYAASEAERERLAALGVTSLKPTGTLDTTVLDNWIIVALGDPAGLGLTFGIARPVADSLRELRNATLWNAGIGLAFIGLAIIGIIPISSRLTRNLSTLTEGAHRIAAGDFHSRVEVTSRDEIGRLADAFNQMAADVERHQQSAVAQERIKKELELGRQIQHQMMPHGPLRFGLTEIDGVSLSAREVGGDFFNYFLLDTGEVALVVGDVSGKGVGAALLMANIQASLRPRLALGQDLAALAHHLDVDVGSASQGSVYATLFVGILDPASRVLRYVNAGHHSPYVVRPNGRLEGMPATGLPIGLLAGRGYVEQRLSLVPGDVLFFYTDGCVEAENDAGGMFGHERLEAVLTATAGADDVLALVQAELAQFRGQHEPDDDTAMMVARVG